MEDTMLVWATPRRTSNVRIRRPARQSHNDAVPSRELTASMFPSGEISTSRRPAACPEGKEFTSKLCVSQTSIRLESVDESEGRGSGDELVAVGRLRSPE